MVPACKFSATTGHPFLSCAADRQMDWQTDRRTDGRTNIRNT